MTTTTLPARRYRGMKCVTPKSEDEPGSSGQRLLDERTWQVIYDPEGTFPPKARMGSQEVYYCLRYGSFVPGTELLQVSNNNGDKIHRRWIVKQRENEPIGDFLDAYTLYNCRGNTRAVHWLMESVFGRMSTVCHHLPPQGHHPARGRRQLSGTQRRACVPRLPVQHRAEDCAAGLSLTHKTPFP